MKNPEDRELGRPNNSKNRRSQMAIDRVDHYKEMYNGFLSPLDFLLLTMNNLDANGVPLPKDSEVDMRARIDCAKTAVKYTNSQLSSIQIEPTEEDEPSEQEKMERIAELMKKPYIQALIDNLE